LAQVINFPDPHSGRHTVLLVDDEFLVRNVLAEILKDAGFHVLQAETASAAISILDEPAPVDLVFSDVKMPDMDGFELARWVSEHKPELPVILASGYVGKTNMAHDLHCTEFLKKPFDFDTVIDKIRVTISRRRQKSA
jgi:DNA-binding NtrC family response regulator